MRSQDTAEALLGKLQKPLTAVEKATFLEAVKDMPEIKMMARRLMFQLEQKDSTQ